MKWERKKADQQPNETQPSPNKETKMRYQKNTNQKKLTYVYYTGIGSNGKHIYTADEFIQLMLKVEQEMPEKDRVENPSKMRLKQWVEWSGADFLLPLLPRPFKR